MNVLEHCHGATASFRHPEIFCTKLHHGVGDNLSYGQTTISFYQIFHPHNSSCVLNSWWPPGPLVTLHRCAAIFEFVEPLLNLCCPYSIISKHLLNLTNCFALRITKLLPKFDAVSLLNSFSHRERNKKILTRITAPRSASKRQRPAHSNVEKQFKHAC